MDFSCNNECICCLTCIWLPASSFHLNLVATGMASRPSRFWRVVLRGKSKPGDNISHSLDAVVFSYVCILKFLFQFNDCMRKVVYLTEGGKKIKFGEFEALFWSVVCVQFRRKGDDSLLTEGNGLIHWALQLCTFTVLKHCRQRCVQQSWDDSGVSLQTSVTEPLNSQTTS